MERFPEGPVFAGIDVAKDRLDVHLRPSAEAFAATRDGVGLANLVERLMALRPTLVVLEATGGFEVAVAAAIAAAGLSLAVASPRQIRDFARATGRLAKTDRLDAEVIAPFAETIRPCPRPIPDQAARALGELVARRRQIVEMIGSESQHRRQLREVRLAWLQDELRRIETDLDDAMRARPAPRPSPDGRRCADGPPASCGRWRATEDLLASVTGIGRTSVRTALYMPTLTAAGRNPTIKALYDRLIARGKPAKVALTAAMRKLLTILNAILKSQKPWQTA